jgi:hypothetical protein
MDDKNVACSLDASATALYMVMADAKLATNDNPKIRQRDKQIQQSGKFRDKKKTKRNGYSRNLAVVVAHNFSSKT